MFLVAVVVDLLLLLAVVVDSVVHVVVSVPLAVVASS